MTSAPGYPHSLMKFLANTILPLLMATTLAPVNMRRRRKGREKSVLELFDNTFLRTCSCFSENEVEMIVLTL